MVMLLNFMFATNILNRSIWNIILMLKLLFIITNKITHIFIIFGIIFGILLILAFRFLIILKFNSKK